MTLDELLKGRPPKGNRRAPRVEIDTATYDRLAKRIGRVPLSQFVAALIYKAATDDRVDIDDLIDLCSRSGDRRRKIPDADLRKDDVVTSGPEKTQS